MKQTEKKQDLRERLLRAAQVLIAERGLSGLKARDVAERAGSALGGLYTVFPDLDGLILEVNLTSFQRLDAVMTQALVGVDDPEAKLLSLVRAYLAFAKSEPNLWRAMFDHRLPEAQDIPTEHYHALMRLMQHIVAPLQQLQPEKHESHRMIRARTLFSAFHGIIAMSLDHRFTGVTSDALESELKDLLHQLVRGMQ
jgi:AcrR family transcriptional regulator